MWYGVDVNNEGICDTFEAYVWEPADNKINAIASAVEAACQILSVDETVRNPQTEQDQEATAMHGMAGRGRPSFGPRGGGGGRGGGRGRGIRAYRGRGGK